MQLFDFFHRDLAVLCLATHLPISGLLDGRPEGTTNDGAIANDENIVGHPTPFMPLAGH